MKSTAIKWIACLFTLLIAGAGIAAWAYYTPYEIHASYKGKNPIYEYDKIDKKDIEVYTLSRMGRKCKLDSFRITSVYANSNGLVGIHAAKEKLGTTIEVPVIKVASSELSYNKVCYEGYFDNYSPDCVENIVYEDGKTVKTEGGQLTVHYMEDEKKENVRLEVDGKQAFYTETFPMIKVDSITTKDKLSVKKALTSKRLDLVLHYEDGKEVNANQEDVTSETIKKPKSGTNKLKCYYNGKEYTVKVKCYNSEKLTGKVVSFSGYGDFKLLYNKSYYVKGANRLNTYSGVEYFNNHRETYYTTSELGGVTTSKPIPGRHVAEDGTIRDEDGYICVAADYKFLKPYEVVLTTLGPGKVYDTGCRYGTVDLYVTW